MSNPGAGFQIAFNDGYVFPNAKQHDLLLHTQGTTKQILLGTSNNSNYATLIVSSNYTTLNGRVNITSPNYDYSQLIIQANDIGGGNYPFQIQSDLRKIGPGSNTNGRQIRLQCINTSGDFGIYDIGVNNNRNLFVTRINSTTPVMTIAHSNVGINTATPSFPLHVVGNSRIEGNLTVNGTMTMVDTNVNTTEQLSITNDGTGPALIINQKGAQPVVEFQDDGNTVFKIIDGGNVGIGTSNPQQRLHVYSSTTDVNMLVDASGGTGQAGIRLKAGSGSTNRAARMDMFALAYVSPAWTMINDYDQNGTNDLRFVLNGGVTSALTLLQSGNVGIGTNNPTHKLHVDGQLLVSSGSTKTAIYPDGTNNVVGIFNNGLGAGILRFYSGENARFEFRNQGAGDTLGLIYWNSGFTNPKYPFTATSSGNVGINNTSPVCTLTVNPLPEHRNAFDHSMSPVTITQPTPTSSTVLNDTLPVLHLCREGTGNEAYGARATFCLSRYENSSVNSRTRLDIKLAHNGYDDNTSMTLRSDGNVGIGTTSPGYKLDVQGTSPFLLRLYGSGSDTPVIRFENTTANTYHVGSTSASSGGGYGWSIYDVTNTAARFIVHNNGNVGIGTITPQSKLHVMNIVEIGHGRSGSPANEGGLWLGGANGTVNYRMWKFKVGGSGATSYDTHRLRICDSDTERLTIDENGNVGIGTSAPGAKLHVVGDAFTSGTVTANNMVVGLQNNAFDNQYINFRNPNNVDDIYGMYWWSSDMMFGRNKNTFRWALKENHGGSGGSSLKDCIAIDITDSGGYSYVNNTRFYTANAERLRINSDGNIGIGTTSPEAKLHVNGNAYFQNSITTANYIYQNSIYFFAQDTTTSFSTWFPFGNTVRVNTGNAYNASSSTFTAPVKGIYNFQFNGYNITAGHVGLAYNSSFVDYNSYQGASLWHITAGDTGMSASWNLLLNQNDYIKCIVFDAGTLEPSRCYWTGTLIHAVA